MTKISLKSFNKSAVAPKVFVLNFCHLNLFRISIFEFRIYCTLFLERFNRLWYNEGVILEQFHFSSLFQDMKGHKNGR